MALYSEGEGRGDKEKAWKGRFAGSEQDDIIKIKTLRDFTNHTRA